jgi:hypothetical protein
MTSDTRDLLIHLVSHMSYMQGQLEAHHQYEEPEGYYWYRESVALREKVQLHLANHYFGETPEQAPAHFR